jgi:hypothetical protein
LFSFHTGPLCEATYRPLGINALWELLGVVASLGDPLCFEIKLSMVGSGTMGGFADGQFCLFEIGDKSIDVITAQDVIIAGGSKVTIEDQSQGMFFWVPKSAMMSYEDMVSAGNAVLLSKKEQVRTRAGQRYKNWVGDRYTDDVGS